MVITGDLFKLVHFLIPQQQSLVVATARTVFKRVVRILLEYFLVAFIFAKQLQLPQCLDLNPVGNHLKPTVMSQQKGFLTSNNQFITRKEMQVAAQITFRNDSLSGKNSLPYRKLSKPNVRNSVCWLVFIQTNKM